MFYGIFTKTCAEKGTSPSALLNKLKISTGSLNRWRNGIEPSGKTLAKIAEELDVSVDYLLGRDDIKKHSMSEDMELVYRLMQDSEDFKNYAEDFQSLPPEGKRSMIEQLDILKRAYGLK